MSASLETRRVFIPFPVDDRKRPYYPDWAGDQLQHWLAVPAMGVSFLVHQEPTPQEVPRRAQLQSV